jgi:AcrR family transcriptional regulator
MLMAMAWAVAEKGYVRVAVKDVIEGAGVSRETFYEQFSDKEDCFLETCQAASNVLVRSLVQSLGSAPSDPLERFDRVLEAYLQGLADERPLPRVVLVESYAAGERAVRLRAEMTHRFVDATAQLLEIDGEEGRFACEALVGAISSMVTARVAIGEDETLPELHAPIMRLVRRALELAG